MALVVEMIAEQRMLINVMRSVLERSRDNLVTAQKRADLAMRLAVLPEEWRGLELVLEAKTIEDSVLVLWELLGESDQADAEWLVALCLEARRHIEKDEDSHPKQ